VPNVWLIDGVLQRGTSAQRAAESSGQVELVVLFCCCAADKLSERGRTKRAVNAEY
jgi:hypothetical protein